jgi:hypothetical protein
MTTTTWAPLCLLTLTAVQPDGLLPSAVRPAEKLVLESDADRARRLNDGGNVNGAFSPDGKFLVTGVTSQGVVLWDVAQGRALPNHFTKLGFGQRLATAFTPDGKHVVGAGRGGPGGSEANPVAVWDVATQKRRSLDEDANDTPFTALAVAPDGKTLALAAGYGRRKEALDVVFWDLASGDEVRRLKGLVELAPGRFPTAAVIEGMAYSPDGRTLALVLEGRVLLVEVASGKLRADLPFATGIEGRTINFRTPMGGAVAFAPDGRALAAGSSDGAVRRFELLTGRELTPLPGHGGPVAALRFTPDGKRLLSYGQDGVCYAWPTAGGPGWQPKAGPLPDAALEKLWDALRDNEPLDLYGSVRALAAVPGQAVPFLRQRVTPVPKGDGAHLDRLVEDLTRDYNERKRAVVELRKIGAPAVSALLRAQQKGRFDELMRRLTQELSNQPATPDQVRAVRALRVLERIGDQDARKLVEELAAGLPSAALTNQARYTLNRLAKAAPVGPEPAPAALWQALAGDDAIAAYQAVRALAGKPANAALLRDRVQEAVAKGTFNDDPKRVARLIDDLGHKTFGVREQANKSLKGLGVLAVPALRKALDAKQPLEVQRRLEKLLEEALKETPPPDVLRIGRALEALEMMHSAEGREGLAALAQVEVTWVREAAAASLQRQR